MTGKKFYPNRKGPKSGPTARKPRTLGPELDALISQCVMRRQELRLSQAQIAKQIGVSVTWVVHIETLSNAPSLRAFLRYVKAVGFALVLLEPHG
jgi:DNA-binding XRE family transcriptional regulator